MSINGSPKIGGEFCINPKVVSEHGLAKVKLDDCTLEQDTKEGLNEETYYAKQYIYYRLKSILKEKESKIDISKLSINRATKIVISSLQNSSKVEDILLLQNIQKLELERKNIEYKKNSLTDKLTGLKNRRFLEIEILKAIELNKRKGLVSCLLIIDIDKFKSINDIYGHNRGDEVLKILGESLKKSLRKTDIYGRWGGEEFIVIIHEAEKEVLKQIAEKLRKRISKNISESINFTDKKITVSIGGSKVKKNDSIETFIERSDNALYSCKNNGRNCTKILNQKDIESIDCDQIKECKI